MSVSGCAGPEPLLSLFGHFGPVQSARGGRARPPHPPSPPGPARSLPVPPSIPAPPPPSRHEQLPVQQGPLLRPLCGGQEPGEPRRGRGGAGTNGGLRAEKSRGCSEGPDALRRVRSRVRGAACAGAALRSWGALTLSRGAPGVWEGSRAPAAPTLAPVPPGSLRGAGGGEWGDGSGSVQLCSRGFPTLCFPIIPCPSGRDVVPLGGP